MIFGSCRFLIVASPLRGKARDAIKRPRVRLLHPQQEEGCFRIPLYFGFVTKALSCRTHPVNQRSVYGMKRRSDGVNERRLFLKIKSRREQYAVRDDVVGVAGLEPAACRAPRRQAVGGWPLRLPASREPARDAIKRPRVRLMSPNKKRDAFASLYILDLEQKHCPAELIP